MTNTKKILVIDDSITNVVLLSAILSEEGYISATALSVSDALKIINRDIPDLILLDLQMPILTGFDFLKNIKRNNSLKKIPIVVVTAYSDEKNIDKAMSLGADDYIEKPIDIEILKTKINKYIHSHANYKHEEYK